jgi:hypothetical protein
VLVLTKLDLRVLQNLVRNIGNDFTSHFAQKTVSSRAFARSANGVHDGVEYLPGSGAHDHAVSAGKQRRDQGASAGSSKLGGKDERENHFDFSCQGHRAGQVEVWGCAPVTAVRKHAELVGLLPAIELD